ncbi:3-oxoadipyl-CoA thiolase [Aestuariispira ectoiniformans]|uniref:3-oxoadipyl-CoA thiolase n=1 Tax=Aestuariispira ectoiniformans TaxID=2775080 RepID=UPI00223B7EAE|nr:3-oxoadipyl-CoA thiolase [Aestuariispira ectoiniformans]
MKNAFICDAVRTPIGRYAGSLSAVRTDDLAAIPIKALIDRNPNIDWAQIEDVIYGCANQAGEDNRNVARMATLLAGLPISVAGATVNRLCGSGMDAIGQAARAIRCGEGDLLIAGGVESMSRAPMVIAKATTAFSRNAEIYDSTIGWRFVNKVIETQYGIESMPETAENITEEMGISREDQDLFAFRSHQKAVEAQKSGFFDKEIVSVTIPQRKKEAIVVTKDEHPRADTSLEKLAQLPAPFREGGSVTAGNAAGVNDGACAVLLASEDMVHKFTLKPRARIIASAVAGVEPRVMGLGPVPAITKVMQRCGLALNDMDVIELNEAFAGQALGVLRQLGIFDDDARVNPNGGAIALGHPLGMSGARLVTTATNALETNGGRYALCSMCIGVGQGIAMVIERV